MYSLEAVRGFYRFDFSSLAAVAFFSVCLEPLRKGGRVGGPAVLDRSVVVDEVWGISNSSPTAARARPVLRDLCPDALSARAGEIVQTNASYWNRVIEPDAESWGR